MLRYIEEPFYAHRTILREFLNDKGDKVKYDECSSKPLEEAKKSCSNREYVYSGYIYYINGTRNESKELHHFFVNKKV